MKLVLTLLVAAVASPSVDRDHTMMRTETQIAAVCFKNGEQVSGMNKICYYNCMGSTVAMTVKSTDLCPMSINN